MVKTPSFFQPTAYSAVKKIPEAEASLIQKLEGAYAHKKDSNPQKTLQSLTEQLSPLHRRSLRHAVERSGQGFIRLTPSADSYFEEILLAVNYGRSLSIIGLAEEGKTHLTLDIIQNGQVFGVPPRFIRKNPDLAYPLIEDLLIPAVAEAERLSPFKIKNFSMPPAPVLSRKTPAESPVKSDKRRALKALKFITRNASGMPKIPTETLPEEQEEKDAYLLIYKNQIVNGDLKFLAAAISDDLVPDDQRIQSDVMLILEALKEDSYGDGTYKITDAPAVVENHRRMPLRSFRADARRLPFQNKQYSDKLRTVYYIDPESKSVILVEIMNHKRFDDLYQTGKRH